VPLQFSNDNVTLIVSFLHYITHYLYNALQLLYVTEKYVEQWKVGGMSLMITMCERDRFYDVDHSGQWAGKVTSNDDLL
jgi:hypothetical protein